MTTPPSDKPDQNFEISGDASLEGVQIGGQAGRDQYTTQIRGDGNTVINNYPGQRPGSGAGLTQQEYRNRQALLRKVNDFWVEGVLKKSLHEQILIRLGMDDRPDTVTPALNRDLLLDEQRIPLPENVSVISIFDQIGIGRSLLILGEPGSGKTITLLQLAQDLVDRAEHNADYLIPVVLNLSSWAAISHRKSDQKSGWRFGKRGSQSTQPLTPAESIANWIVEQLNAQYQVPRKLGQQWVDKQHLLLLLDGLDEVAADRRNDCVIALNAFQQEHHTEMVVCCRIKDYQALQNRLNFDRAISLKPLTLDQGLQYLDRLNSDLTSLKHLLTEDANLRELAQTPLMLHLMVLAYQGIASEDLPHVQTRSQRQQQLFDHYIDRMFERSRQFAYAGRRSDVEVLPYSRQQTLYWLRWLAQRMVETKQTVFLIETMQPSWLQSEAEHEAYSNRNFMLSGLIGGVSSGLITALIGPIFLLSGVAVEIETVSNQGSWSSVQNGLMLGLYMGLMNGMIGGAVSGRLIELAPDIELVDQLNWSWQLFKENEDLLFTVLMLGLGLGFIGGIGFGLMGGLLFGLMGSLLGGLSGVSFGLMFGLIGIDVEVRTLPNQGIWNSAKNGLIGGLLSALSLGLNCGFIGLVLGLIIKPENSWERGLMVGAVGSVMGGLSLGLCFGLIAGSIAWVYGLMYGGAACIQHFNLRSILYRKGRIPWNYAQFLDYAAERLFLQKVGGGYIFVHRSLMEHFAQMEIGE